MPLRWNPATEESLVNVSRRATAYGGSDWDVWKPICHLHVVSLHVSASHGQGGETMVDDVLRVVLPQFPAT